MPKMKPGIYKRGKDYIFFTDVRDHHGSSYASGFSTLTTSTPLESPHVQAASVEMSIHAIHAAGYRRVRPEALPLAWLYWARKYGWKDDMGAARTRKKNPRRRRSNGDETVFRSTDRHLHQVLSSLIAGSRGGRGERVLITFVDGTSERGRVGRSTGVQKVPLIIKTTRSTGGEMLSDDRIQSIWGLDAKGRPRKHYYGRKV